MLIEISLTARLAPPLNLPKGLASVTVPDADAPEGITSLPSTWTGSARVAVKDCPAWLVLELSASPRRTVRTVPAGITTGLGASAIGLCGAAALLVALFAVGAGVDAPDG